MLSCPWERLCTPKYVHRWVFVSKEKHFHIKVLYTISDGIKHFPETKPSVESKPIPQKVQWTLFCPFTHIHILVSCPVACLFCHSVNRQWSNSKLPHLLGKTTKCPFLCLKQKGEEGAVLRRHYLSVYQKVSLKSEHCRFRACSTTGHLHHQLWSDCVSLCVFIRFFDEICSGFCLDVVLLELFLLLLWAHLNIFYEEQLYHERDLVIEAAN